MHGVTPIADDQEQVLTDILSEKDSWIMRRNLLFIAIMAILSVVVYSLEISSNQYVLFLPVIVLAIFRISAKK
jgi:uncharacterized membrane protein YeiH